MLKHFIRKNSYKVIGSELSPYTNKVYAYLEYKNIPYETVFASAEVFEKIIEPKVGWRVVPILITPEDEVIQDSEDIILHLENKFPEKSIYPKTPKHKLATQLLQMYGDQYMVLPIMHYRWSFPENYEKFVFYNFGHMAAPQLFTEEKTELGMMLGTRFKNFCKPLGINESTYSDIEKNYLDLLAEMTTHLEQYPYFLGNVPTIGDFSIHGMIYAHLIRDARTGFITKSNSPFVNNWCERMRGYAKEHPILDLWEINDEGKLIRNRPAENFLENDEIPETLMPILKRVVSDWIEPICVPAANQLREKLKTEFKEGGKLPRPLTKEPIKIRIGKTETTRINNPFDIYRMEEMQKIIKNHNLSSFLSEIDPTGAIEKCRIEDFALVRKNNQVHAVSK